MFRRWVISLLLFPSLISDAPCISYGVSMCWRFIKFSVKGEQISFSRISKDRR
jgi:hypothetical protein